MLKKQILYILKSAEGYISGQQISKSLGISRTSVWKSVEGLRAEGYSISSASNKGYKLEECTDLNKFELEEELASFTELEIFYEDLVDSTNNWAKRYAEQGFDKSCLFVSAEQSAGRGRRGRSWLSLSGEDICMSLLIRPDIDAEKASMLTLIMALSLARSIEKLLDIGVCIKWPNDILINNKKIAGILTEMSSDMDGIKYIICGIGINVNSAEVSEELSNMASSIYRESSVKLSRKELIFAIISEFFSYYKDFLKCGNLSFIKAEYEALLANIGRELVVEKRNESFTARGRGINEFGELLVEDAQGKIVSITSGEVSIRGIYSYI